MERLKVIIVGALLIPNLVWADNFCKVSATRQTIQDIVGNLAIPPLENPDDKYACIFDKESESVEGHDVLERFLSGTPEKVANPKLYKCIGSWLSSSELISPAELMYREQLCEERKADLRKFMKDPKAELGDDDYADIVKNSKDFLSKNQQFIAGGPEADLVKRQVYAKIEEEKAKCKGTLRVRPKLNSGMQATVLSSRLSNKKSVPEYEEGVTYKYSIGLEDPAALDRNDPGVVESFLAEAEALKDEALKTWDGDYLSNNRSKGYFCGTPGMEKQARRVVKTARVVDDVVIELEDLKKPNAWQLSSEKGAEMASAIKKHKDYKLIEACAERVEVEASASKLRNDPELMAPIYKKYGKEIEAERPGINPERVNKGLPAIPPKYDFYALSYARAREIQAQVVGPLMKSIGKSLPVVRVLGVKNSGASGPCPYQAVKGSGKDSKHIVERDPATIKNKDFDQSVQQAQMARVRIRLKKGCADQFNPAPANAPHEVWMTTPPCMGFEYVCESSINK